MPIRFVDKTGVVVGRLSSTLGSHTAAFTGTFNVASARTGTIASQMTNATANFVGAFQSAGRTGTIASTLGQFVAAFRSIEDPAWAAVVNQSLVVGVPFSLSLDSICTDDNAQPITYTITSGTLPAGLSQSGSRGETISGTPTSLGNFNVTFLASDSISDGSDWTTRSTAANVTLAQNFSSFANRAALMAYLESIEAQCPNNGPRYTFVGADFSDTRRYDDPPPAAEKVGLDSSIYLTGGKSLRLRFRAAESANDNGPLIELPVSQAFPVTYVTKVWRPDAIALSFEYNNGDRGRKIIFLNDLNFAEAQVVGIIDHDDGPWVNAYRVTGGDSSTFQYLHSSTPYGSNKRQHYGGIDNGGSSSTTALFDARFGPSQDSRDPNNSNFAPVNRPIGDEWYVTTYMLDQTYVGSVSRGMVKMWGGAYGSAPQLQVLSYRDADLDPFSSTQTNSVRPVWRPERATGGTSVFPGVDHGYYLDQIIVTGGTTSAGTVPPKHPGGFDLPSPGQTIPAGQPTAGTVDD